MASGALQAVFRRLLRHRDRSSRTDGQLLEEFRHTGDETAFELLLSRHGPMVLGVCRRVLANPDDVEDAFQAIFLVFVNKARTIRKRQSVGSWLHGVAYRTSLDARAAALRRRKHERQASVMATQTVSEPSLESDLRPILDAEIDQLDEKHRAPLVLCYLEGQSIEEAARLLGWPKGTLAGRLARARDQLRARLVRRGVALSAGALAGALSTPTASAQVTAPLATSTLKAATLYVAGGSAAVGAVSASVAALAQGVIKTMFISKLKTTITSVLALSLFAGIAGLWAHAHHAHLGAGPALASVPAPDDDAKDELKKLHGTWLLVSGETQGVAFTQDQCKNFSLSIFRTGKVELTALLLVVEERVGSSFFGTEEATLEAKIKTDTKATPKRMSLAFDKDAVKRYQLAPQWEAVYQLDGDKLQICLFDPAGKAPEKFTTAEGTGRVLYVLKRRVKDEEKEEKPK